MVAEARKAHANGADITALLATRTALIRMLRDQDAGNLKDLVEPRKITELLYR